jgi:hypothetical protein
VSEERAGFEDVGLMIDAYRLSVSPVRPESKQTTGKHVRADRLIGDSAEEFMSLGRLRDRG